MLHGSGMQAFGPGDGFIDGIEYLERFLPEGGFEFGHCFGNFLVCYERDAE